MFPAAQTTLFLSLPRSVQLLTLSSIAGCRQFSCRSIAHSSLRALPRRTTPSQAIFRLFHYSPVLAKKAKGGKDKGQDESGAAAAPSFDTEEFSQLMDKALDALKKEFDKLRTGQVSAGMLDHVKVEAYGGHVPLSQVGQVVLRDPKTLAINVFDQSVVKAVEKAVRDSGMNLSPIAENDIVRVPVPKMTKEFKESIVKTAKDMGENAKLSIRRARQKGMDAIKRVSKSMGKDDVKVLEKEIQDMHDKRIKAADDLVQRKMKAIME